MDAGFRENAFNYLLAMRLIPLFPFWLVNLAPAFAEVRPGTFVAATALGIVPGTFVFALVGNGLGAFIAAGEEPDLSIVLRERKSVVSGKSLSVRVDLGGRRIFKKKTPNT